METLKLRIAHWNINGRGGQASNKLGFKFPSFIEKALHARPADDMAADDIPDVITLVEFYKYDGWGGLINDLQETYIIFLSKNYGKCRNQVFLAVKKSLNPIITGVSSVIPQAKKKENTPAHPEFLQVNVEIQGRPLSLITTRIKTGDVSEREDQLSSLAKHIRSIPHTVVCTGDFNCLYGPLNEAFKGTGATVYGSRTTNGYHSFVHQNNGKCQLDWLVAKGVKDVTNPYPDCHESPRATCDWSFLGEDCYKGKDRDDYLGFVGKNELPELVGLPDHAILRSEINL